VALGRGWVILRGNASSDAECGIPGTEAIGAFLEASQGIEFAGQSQEEIYGWCMRPCSRRSTFARARRGGRDPDVYAEGNRAEPGADHASDRAVPKDGRAKVASWPAASVCPQVHRGGHPAAAVVDRAHERLSGPATRHVLEREYKVYGKREFARLAEISVSHLYNLRATAAYRRRAAVFVPRVPRPSRSESDADPIRGRTRPPAGGQRSPRRFGRSQGSSISTQWTR